MITSKIRKTPLTKPNRFGRDGQLSSSPINSHPEDQTFSGFIRHVLVTKHQAKDVTKVELTINQLSKTYKGKVQALNHVNLHMSNGMFGLLGPNGAGKSTLMQILATLLPPSEGEVKFGGLTLGQDDHEIRRLLGYLPQSFGLYNKLTGEEFLLYIAMLKGINTSSRGKLVNELLDKVNLGPKAKSKIKTYSGGMKQRIGIAQAIMGDPQIIIVDEPTAGLDPEERIRFRDLLEELSSDRIVLLSTHIVADIESSCKQLAIMDKGKLLFNGTPNQLTDHVEGKVWLVDVKEEEWRAGLVLGRCVSRRKSGNGYELRIIADQVPFHTAKPVRPDMEDGYMAYVGGSVYE
ncbi:MAG: transporter related protein [Paenibacillus sp.]|nr:transporter related protein [Paenibacillus sp.]